MSVLIKGMKMPECCYDCPLFGHDSGECQFLHKEPYELSGMDVRLSDCPLIEDSDNDVGEMKRSEDDPFVLIFGKMLAMYLRTECVERATLNWDCAEVKRLCESIRRDLELVTEETRKLATERSERGYVEHQLKILPEYFEAVAKGEKNFELRKDDRGYQVGDYVALCEWDGEKFTGRRIGMFKIRYILRDCPEYGLMNGYCILGF